MVAHLLRDHSHLAALERTVRALQQRRRLHHQLFHLRRAEQAEQGGADCQQLQSAGRGAAEQFSVLLHRVCRHGADERCTNRLHRLQRVDSGMGQSRQG